MKENPEKNEKDTVSSVTFHIWDENLPKKPSDSWREKITHEVINPFMTSRQGKNPGYGYKTKDKC